MSEPILIKLPAMLDFAAAASLKASLSAARGLAVSIDASEVERMGALCLQVLASARATWVAEGCGFDAAARSEAFSSALALMGGADLLEQAA